MRWEQHLNETWGARVEQLLHKREAGQSRALPTQAEGAQIEDAVDEFLARILLGDAALAVRSISMGGGGSWSLHMGECPRLQSEASTRPLYQHIREMLLIEAAVCSCVLLGLPPIEVIEEHARYGTESWGRVRELLIGLGEAKLCRSENDVAIAEAYHLEHRSESELRRARQLAAESQHGHQSTIAKVFERAGSWAAHELWSTAAAGAVVAQARAEREGRAAWVVSLHPEAQYLAGVGAQLYGELVCALEKPLLRTETTTWVLGTEVLAKYIYAQSACWPGLTLGRELTLPERSGVSTWKLLLADGVALEQAVAAATAATVQRR